MPCESEHGDKSLVVLPHGILGVFGQHVSEQFDTKHGNRFDARQRGLFVNVEKQPFRLEVHHVSEAFQELRFRDVDFSADHFETVHCFAFLVSSGGPS